MAKEHDHSFSKSRLESLTDGIFATVMTILILSLVVPAITGANLSKQLLSVILSFIPSIVIYIFSFSVLLVMWIGHNNIMRYTHGVNPRLLWLNGLFLLLIGMVPFSTAFLGRYPLQQPAIFLYGINFFFLALVFRLFYNYVNKHHEGKNDILERASHNIAIGLVYIIALLFSFVSPYISLGLFALMPVFYIYQAFFGMYRQVK
jgi:uncharacterized membrane protein